MTPTPNPLTELTLEQLRARTSIKWTRYDPDVLPLWVAEMDVSLAPPVHEALARALRDSDTGYPGSLDMVHAFVGFAQRHWEWPTLEAAHVVPTSGVIGGYVDAIALGTGPGDAVIVNPPVYPPFFSYVEASGRVMVNAPLGADMRLDFEVLEATFAEATTGGKRAAYLLCSPHNPGGTVHTRAELEAVAALADRFGVLVVVDEIHAPLVYPGAEFVPYLTVAGGEHGISLMAASKAFNLAALPAAVMAFGTEAARLLPEYGELPHHWPSNWGAIATAAAYRDGDEWLAALIAGLDLNRTLLGELLAAHVPAIRYQVPDSTYLAWLDCRALNLGDDPSEAFLERVQVAVCQWLDVGIRHRC